MTEACTCFVGRHSGFDQKMRVFKVCGVYSVPGSKAKGRKASNSMTLTTESKLTMVGFVLLALLRFKNGVGMGMFRQMEQALIPCNECG